MYIDKPCCIFAIMERDDIDNFRDYSLQIEILEAAKTVADDLEDVVFIDSKLTDVRQERGELALRMIKEGNL